MEINSAIEREIEIRMLINNNRWNATNIHYMVSTDMADYICSEIPLETEEHNDKVWWIGSPSERFSIQSAYHIVK